MEFWGTIGPACANVQTLRDMKERGMTGLRMNLSHGKLAEHTDWLSMIRQAGIRDLLIDLQGPELRIGRLKEPLLLPEGGTLTLVPEQIPDTAGKDSRGQAAPEAFSAADAAAPCVSCPPALFAALVPGQELLFDDGKLAARVMRRTAAAAECTVTRGGTLSGRKSVAAPGLSVKQPALTAEDLENLRLAGSLGVTAVMQPFVRSREDLTALRAALADCGAGELRIYAKIENAEGVARLPELIHEADCIVIARGDLGNAMPLWELPGCQKRIAALCRRERVPFMVVTQMLDSMTARAVPTRAEVCDIYNAVTDGADSVMLTGETAAGNYPVLAMEYLIRTAGEALRDLAAARP